MIRPSELIDDDAWAMLTASVAGDTASIRRLLERNRNLYREGFCYNQPLYYAVREGHLDAVRMLLEAGSDPGGLGTEGENLVTVARDRDFEEIAALLEEARSRVPAPMPEKSDDPIHIAAEQNDVRKVRDILDKDPQVIERGDRYGATPLHRAVAASARDVVELLLDCGADIHARHGSGFGSDEGYAPARFQPIDCALWTDPYYSIRGDFDMARLLRSRGANYDVVIATAFGDLKSIQAMLDEDPKRLEESRPSGKRALSTALQFRYGEIAKFLLERGADPNSSDGSIAPRGMSLHIAARRGDREMVDLLLAHGADPNSWIDSSGNATFAATPELRKLLIAKGGKLDPYDLVWLDEDDEVVRRVREDPASADAGCGGVFTAAVTRGKRELIERLLEAGARVPPVVTACRSYLMEDPDLLDLLLKNGMNPDLPNWQLATPLHDLCGRDGRGRARGRREESARVLLDAGASISARDDDYKSTPLAWAARNNLPDMVSLLLDRGAPVSLDDDKPWATPLAWATKRGNDAIVDMLRRAGARE